TACRRTAESPVATSSYPLASLDLTRDVAITPSHPGTHDHAAARRALARRRPCQPPTKAQVPAAAELDERPPRRVLQAPADQQAPLRLHLPVERRGRVRREDVEGGAFQAVGLDPLRRRGEDAPVVVVEAEHEAAVDLDAVVVQDAHAPGVVLGARGALSRVPE